MVRKANTIKLHGNDYAQVAERVRLFREACPSGKIITERVRNTDGNAEKEMTYRTYIWKDRSTYLSGDMLSCDASAEASMVININKDKEKLETISVGRALGILGYLGSGQIASSEEMEEFYAEKDQKAIQEALEHKETVIDDIKRAKNVDELRTIYVQSNLTNDPDVVKAKDEMKDKLIAAKPKKEKTEKPLPGRSQRHEDAAIRGDKAREEAHQRKLEEESKEQ